LLQFIQHQELVQMLLWELISDYCDTNSHSKHKQCLIDLEQLIIRHGMPTGIIFEYTKKDANPINYDMLDWIKRITKLEKKIVLLKEYMVSFATSRCETSKTFFFSLRNVILTFLFCFFL
jgi:hypothetical protein